MSDSENTQFKPIFATIKQSRQLFGIGESVLRRGVKSGRFPAVRNGRVWLIDVAATADVLRREAAEARGEEDRK